MSRSVLLQLARDSIQEVYEAQRTIDRTLLLQQQPLLSQPISVVVNIYVQNELKGSSKSDTTPSSLLQEIIKHAKKAVFENADGYVLTTSQYLLCEVELLLQTPDGIISEKDPSILKTHHI